MRFRLNRYIWLHQFHDMKSVVILAFLVASLSLPAQSLPELYAASKKSYENKEFALFLKQTKILDSLRPSHPAFTYNLAIAYALNGFKNESVTVLKKAILMNNKTQFEASEEFAGIAATDAFKQLLLLKSDLDNTIASSKKVVALSEKDLHPEGLVFLKKSNTWLAGSIRKRKITSFDAATGKCSDWLKTADMLAVFAIQPDQDERFLWVATSAMPEMLGFSNELDGKAEILKVEISTRKIVKRFKIEGKHVFGDIAISRNGGVFIPDSASPIIYTIKNDALSVWLNLEKQAHNLQGITFNTDFSIMYVADYLKGILAVPVGASSNYHWLKFPENTTPKGIDGIRFYNNSLIAVHNGVNPIRIVRYFLDKKGEISGYRTLDHNRAEFDEPALAAISDGALYFFANSPWKAYDKKFNLNTEAFENPMLFKYPLD